MRSPGLWLGLAILVAGGAMTAWLGTRLAFAPLRTRALPGFDFDLPAGDKMPEDLTYEQGRVQINRVARSGENLQVTWEPGGLFSDEDVARTNHVVATALKAEARAISITPPISIAGEAPTRSWAVSLGSVAAWATQIVCGTRRVTLMSLGDRSGLERLHRRIAASFRCHPDAAREPIPGDVPVVFEVGPAWSRLPSVDGDIEIGDGGFVMIARPVAAGILPDTVRQYVAAAIPGFAFGERVGDDWPFVEKGDGETADGWLTLRACPDGGQLLVMAMTGADGGPEARTKARALLPRARCRRPGEPPQKWPEASR